MKLRLREEGRARPGVLRCSLRMHLTESRMTVKRFSPPVTASGRGEYNTAVSSKLQVQGALLKKSVSRPLLGPTRLARHIISWRRLTFSAKLVQGSKLDGF